MKENKYFIQVFDGNLEICKDCEGGYETVERIKLNKKFTYSKIDSQLQEIINHIHIAYKLSENYILKQLLWDMIQVSYL